ncbi:MAG: flagellar filament capping protein FliD [Phycisphaerales bacterium]
MSGISSNTGLISGIDTNSLINQLLSLEARPRVTYQRRVAQLQQQQAAYLDLNSRLGTIRSAATAFNTQRLFAAARAASSDEDVLTATARTGAAPGSYSFIVDRLVTTQQDLSRGFVDRATTPLGLTSLTLEGDEGRLDRDQQLASLNGGTGITRGGIQIKDASGATAVIDLSRVSTVNEVIDAINSAEGIDVTASVEGDHFVIRNNAAGAQGLTVRNHNGSSTASSLGIEHATDDGQTTVTGSAVHRVAAGSLIQSLNDGNGIRITNSVGSGAKDFTITVSNGVDPPRTIDVYLGEVLGAGGAVTTPRATTVQNVVDRINAAGLDAGTQYLSASISADGSGLTLSAAAGFNITTVADTSGAAADLGIASASNAQTLTGRRVIAAINSTLTGNLLGGAGLSDGYIEFKLRDGSTLDTTLATSGSVSDILSQLNAISPSKLRASLDETGTGFVLTDLTTGSDTFGITGGAADSLGLGGAPDASGAVIRSDRLQHRYISLGTALSSLNGGSGVGTGRFTITDSSGLRATVDIANDSRSVGDVIQEINSRNINIRARINDNGDGILIEERDPLTGGSVKIKVQDDSGSVASNLRIAGEAADNDTHNFIDGSFERVVQLAPADTLESVVSKINQARAGVSATIINDGSSTAPFHLSLTSTQSGRAGRFTVASAGADLGLSRLSTGTDARVFFGSGDPASAVLLQSSTNQVDNVISGVTIDLHTVSASPVTVNVSTDTAAIEDGINAFITAYNALIDRVKTLTAYDAETQRAGTLLGDSTVEQIRQDVFRTVTGPPDAVSGPYQNLSQIGIGFSRTGQLELDAERFRAALAENPDAVRDLIAAREQRTPEPEEIRPGVFVNNSSPSEFTSLGIFEKMGKIVEKYTDRIDGVLSRRKTTLDQQIRAQNTRISDLDERLERRRAALQRQFQSLESTLAQLQSQQSALGSLTSRLG